MTKVTDEQIADVCCSHNALARSTEPGITGEGVQDYWYCTLCESRFIPQWHLLDYLSTTIKERDTTIAEQAAEIERLRGTLEEMERDLDSTRLELTLWKIQVLLSKL